MNKILLTLVFSIPSLASSQEIYKITLIGPTLYQDGTGKWKDQLTNPSVPGTDPFGQPNNHFPWLNPGGVPGDKRPDNFAAIFEYEIPGKIIVKQIKGELPPRYSTNNDLLSWKFPVGTIARVRLFYEAKEFAVHQSVKVSEGQGIECWEGKEIILSKPPSWYKSPTNCVDCHSDVGKHARILHPNRNNYYNWLRGSDGRFSWVPKANEKNITWRMIQ